MAMLSQESIDRLCELIEPSGPSGFETYAAQEWRDQADAAEHVAEDTRGNSYAIFNAKGNPTVLLAGHIDEIGVIVMHIDENGFLFFKTIGGWDPAVLVGQRIYLMTSKGPVFGAIVRPATHMMTYDEQKAEIKVQDLWIDVGCVSRADAVDRGIRPGDHGVIDVSPICMPNHRFISRALDNRLGCFIALEAATAYATEAPQNGPCVIAAAATTEETMYPTGGICAVAKTTSPDIAILVDLTLTSDHPNSCPERTGERSLGSGPALLRGGITNPRLFEVMEDTAKALGIPYTIEAAPGPVYTDTDGFAAIGANAALGFVGIPSRYMHTPNEMVSLEDVAATITLLAEVCRRIEPGMDWLP